MRGKKLGGIEWFAPFGVDADHLGTVAACDIAHALAENPVHTHHHGIARSHEIDERGLHSRRPCAADRQRQRIDGRKDAAQAVVRAVEQLQELGVEVAQDRPG